MEINVISGTHVAATGGSLFIYEGRWWRSGRDVEWNADVFIDHAVAASPSGKFTPAAPGTEEQTVRRSIEPFIDSSDGAGEQNRGTA